MIQFSKLRLHGFKSFVEKTELEIGPGLTGIVGPNGCGKSNLVEALRWSMGENSSKKMRGGSRSMEDVIFSGTAKRSPRQSAEVNILIDNTARTAPAPFNDSDEIEIVRRIERDHGSSYRINGRPARARDVQIFYADILSGANSPYLVSQGKVTNMIQAKPHERRMLLEEAAGITGLYARRHEAEIRLRATDSNLKRIEDLVSSMETRLQSLKKQARQANRYRNLSAQIRQLEVTIAVLEWRMTHSRLRAVEKNFGEAESRVAEHMTVVTQLTKTQNTQSVDLPDLRQKAAEMSAALQAHNLALQRLEDEAERLGNESSAAKAQLEQARTDKVHEEKTLEENSHSLEKLEREEKNLRDGQDNKDSVLQEKQQAKDTLEEKVGTLEGAYTLMTEQVAADKAKRQNLEYRIAQDEEKIATLKERISGLKEREKEAQEQSAVDDETDVLRQAVTDLEEQIEHSGTALEKLVGEYEKIEIAREEKTQELRKYQSEKERMGNEINTLESILDMYSDGENKPVLDDVITDPGFEEALSCALGDSLMASIENDAPVVWQKRDIKNYPSLPDGVTCLRDHVKAPPELAFALSQIGYVEDDEKAAQYINDLKPGQSIVSGSGAYWRWDGLHMKEGSSDRHAVQLQQKNKMKELQVQLPKVQKALEKAESALDKTEQQREKYRAEREEVKERMQEDERILREKRRALNESIEAHAAHKAAMAKIEEALDLATEDLKTTTDDLSAHKKEMSAFDDKSLHEQQEKADTLKAQLAAEREKLHDAIRDFETIRQEHSRSKARLQAIADERISLQNRCIRSRERIKELDGRIESLSEKIEELKKRPSEIKSEKAGLLDKISVLEKDKNDVSDRLAQCESELADTNKALREAEALLARAREDRAHAQATTSERQSQLEDIVRRIREKFDMTPNALQAHATLDEDKEYDLDELKTRREDCVRQRDMIGPVNLRADEEAEELEKELTAILSERNDLVEAITELRQAIQKLNREARDRLQIAFDHINEHFKDMFSRLFKGGRAHLELIESDDPLEAGLEIFAEPPGKALQSLSLLSGGEQTLTAIALIFAMFLTNPAPICVLDEVDAPLDDANVDRFCDVLEEFAEKGRTRFLVITHHRLSMARMDRLYGVTMAEKGVSQLVSVDMNQQLDFLEEVA